MQKPLAPHTYGMQPALQPYFDTENNVSHKVRNRTIAIPRGLRHIPPVAQPACGCGSSSGVEHNLAKVGVEGSNPFSRSNTGT